MHRHRYAKFRHRVLIIAAAVILLALVLAAIEYDLHRTDRKKPNPTSTVQSFNVEGDIRTFRSPYFQFQDSGKWVLSTSESNDTKFVYYKYRGLLVEHQLIVYINQVPIPLYLAVSRVLPVRIVNGNSFDATTVSNPCGQTYGASELHKIRIVTINEAQMLCDPDTPQYSIVLSVISGDYQLNLQRLSGAPAKFVITYRDLRLSPGPDTILRIANSFQSL